MAIRSALFLMVVGMGVVYAQSGDAPRPENPVNNPLMDCAMGMEDNGTQPYASLNPETRFCQFSAVQIRRDHFYCRGTLDEDMNVIDGTELAPFPDNEEMFWTIALQYPALSYMDVGRKEALFYGIRELLRLNGCPNVRDFREFCVSDAFPINVAEYSESVIITLYNLGDGLTGTQIDQCFRDALSSGNAQFLTRFRGRQALIINLNGTLTLNDMFDLNIGPASSIGNPTEDPTLRAIYLTSFAGNETVDEARSRIGSFASNPNPINYGLEAGDIVFAVFGSILLIILAAVILLGFFIHPFFLS